MIPYIIELIQSNDFYNVSENMEIVKGKNEMVTTWKDGKEKIKRQWLLKK